MWLGRVWETHPGLRPPLQGGDGGGVYGRMGLDAYVVIRKRGITPLGTELSSPLPRGVMPIVSWGLGGVGSQECGLPARNAARMAALPGERVAPGEAAVWRL